MECEWQICEDGEILGQTDRLFGCDELNGIDDTPDDPYPRKDLHCCAKRTCLNSVDLDAWHGLVAMTGERTNLSIQCRISSRAAVWKIFNGTSTF